MDDLEALESYTIYELTGREIQSRKFDENSGSINLGNLQAGIYLLKIELEGKSQSFRIQRMD